MRHAHGIHPVILRYHEDSSILLPGMSWSQSEAPQNDIPDDCEKYKAFITNTTILHTHFVSCYHRLHSSSLRDVMAGRCNATAPPKRW